MKKTIFSGLLSATMIFGAVATTTLTSCEKRAETIGEKVDDGLDRRPAEGVRDAAEDTKDAVKDAAKDTKDAVKDATN